MPQEDIKKQLLEIWLDDMKACSMTFGSENYVTMVERLKNDIVDLPGVAPFKKLMDRKWDELSVEGRRLMAIWKSRHPQESHIEEFVLDKEAEIRSYLSEKLVNFLLQLVMEKMFL